MPGVATKQALDVRRHPKQALDLRRYRLTKGWDTRKFSGIKNLNISFFDFNFASKSSTPHIDIQNNMNDEVEVGKPDDGRKKKVKKFPRERLLRKIQVNNEREQQIQEKRMMAYMNPKKITKPTMEKVPQKRPNLAERIIEKKRIEIQQQQRLRLEMYNHIEDLERKVYSLLQQLIGNEDSNEPYIDPGIWTMFKSEEFQQEIDKFLQGQS